MTQRYDIKIIYEQTLKGLHDPDATWTGILTETAGNALLFIGNIFIANIGGYFPAGNCIGRTHGLA